MTIYPSGIQNEQRRTHQSSNRGGQQTKARQQDTPDRARRTLPTGKTAPGIVTAPSLGLPVVSIGPNTHDALIWVAVEAFLAAWYVAHPELAKPFLARPYAYARDSFTDRLLALPKRKPVPPSVVVKYREDNRMVPALRAYFQGDVLVYVHQVGTLVKVPRAKLLGLLLKGDLMVSGDLPAWARLPEPGAGATRTKPAPKPRGYHPSYESFTYNLPKTGGGSIRFMGEYRHWNWVRSHCACAHCGASLSLRASDEPCRSRCKGGRYYTCDGRDAHVIRCEADLTWQDDLAHLRDDGVEQPTVADIAKNYPDLIAQPDMDEVPY